MITIIIQSPFAFALGILSYILIEKGWLGKNLRLFLNNYKNSSYFYVYLFFFFFIFFIITQLFLVYFIDSVYCAGNEPNADINNNQITVSDNNVKVVPISIPKEVVHGITSLGIAGAIGTVGAAAVKTPGSVGTKLGALVAAAGITGTTAVFSTAAVVGQKWAIESETKSSSFFLSLFLLKKREKRWRVIIK